VRRSDWPAEVGTLSFDIFIGQLLKYQGEKPHCGETSKRQVLRHSEHPANHYFLIKLNLICQSIPGHNLGITYFTGSEPGDSHSAGTNSFMALLLIKFI